MAKREKNKSIYTLNMTEKDREIKKLELMRKDIEEDLADAVHDYVRAGGKRSLKLSEKSFDNVLLDAEFGN